MSAKDFELNQPLEALVAEAERRFGGIVYEEVSIAGVTLQIPQIKDMPRYLDRLVGKTRPGDSVELPLWAKMWPSCLMLGMFMARCPLPEGARVLEVGAGVGVSGLVAASRGLKVTVSDVEPDALLFSRIGVLKNGLEANVEVVDCDFTKAELPNRFDMIIGCEILYQDHVYEPLHAFLERHLAETPEAEIVIALDSVRKGQGFFRRAEGRYRMMKQEFPYKDEETGQERASVLYRLRRTS